MHYAVIMISCHMEVILQPITEWIFGICIFRAVNMQAEVNTDKQVTEVTEDVLPVGNNQKENKNKC